MNQQTQFAAQILETSASAYAGYAASLLLERHPEIAERYGPSAMSQWKTSFAQRVLELAAALGAEEPTLFVARVRWARKALRARDMEEHDLVGSLGCLREVLSEELPETSRDDAARYVELALEALAEPVAEMGAGLDPQDPTGRLALRYLQTVLEGNSRGAIDLLLAASEDGSTVQDLYTGVLLPAQREIGGMWHLGEIGISEEHFVTSTTERAMSILTQRASRKPANGKTMVAGAVAGNRHGLGPRILADFFELAGWRAICLGADVPAADLATACVYFDADLLMISAALAVQIKATRQTIESARGLPGRKLEILVGGGAFADAPELWRRLGADGYAATADSAVVMGARLVGLGEPDG